uniref:G_PROTEIN_RECEP_F3_4 domain-containing protein n=1 Tax=Macrostomum lignano TaxID=282301 RepID=A0A1I8FTI7_9PLAT
MRMKDQTYLQPFTSGLLRLLDTRGEDGGLGGQVKVRPRASGTAPVFVCRLGRWLFSYAVPFLSGQPRSLAVKGWIVLEFDINELEVNQCLNDSTFGSFYANDVCNQATTECSHIPGMGFTDQNFMCKCRKYFHHGNFTESKQQYLLHLNGRPSNYSGMECGPCPAACPDSCATDGRCLIKYDLDKLRAVPLIVQTFFMTICLLTAGIVFRARKNRVIKAAVWILLELFLLGVAMLYATVFLMYLQPSYEICFMIPWFREIGFAVTYGTLVVKIYRILCSFQSRKAHRVHVRDRDLLKYLGGIVTVATGFMAAWTAATLDHGPAALALTGQLLLEDSRIDSDSDLSFRVCAIGYWEAVCAAGELVFLAFGLFLLLLRAVGAVRLRRGSLHHRRPGAGALRVLGLPCGQLWYVHSPPRSTVNSRSLMYSQVDANLGEAMNPMAIASNGDVEVLETNISDMNPEDIRV